MENVWRAEHAEHGKYHEQSGAFLADAHVACASELYEHYVKREEEKHYPGQRETVEYNSDDSSQAESVEREGLASLVIVVSVDHRLQKYGEYECAEKIENFVLEKRNYQISDEEKMYLTIHIQMVVSKGSKKNKTNREEELK